MADWSFNVFNSTTVFSVASGFLCLGTQHSSNRTAFSFEAVLMLLAILAAFLSFLSSSEISIFGSTLTLVATCVFFSFSTFSLGALDVSDFVSRDKIVNLLVATLSENRDTGMRYSPSATRSAPATGLSKNPGPSIGPSTHQLSSPSLLWSSL